MNIAGLGNAVTSASSASNMGQIGVAVAAKALDTQESMGAGLVNMINAADMERSVNPYVGGGFDVRL